MFQIYFAEKNNNQGWIINWANAENFQKIFRKIN